MNTKIKATLATLGTSAVLTGVMVGAGALTANAATPSDATLAPAVTVQDVVTRDIIVADVTTETEAPSDGADVGPDADPNEPGHQDADESGETA